MTRDLRYQRAYGVWTKRTHANQMIAHRFSTGMRGLATWAPQYMLFGTTRQVPNDIAIVAHRRSSLLLVFGFWLKVGLQTVVEATAHQLHSYQRLIIGVLAGAPKARPGNVTSYEKIIGPCWDLTVVLDSKHLKAPATMSSLHGNYYRQCYWSGTIKLPD